MLNNLNRKCNVETSIWLAGDILTWQMLEGKHDMKWVTISVNRNI